MLVIVISAAWLAVAAFVLAVCRAGARGDAAPLLDRETQRPHDAPEEAELVTLVGDRS